MLRANTLVSIFWSLVATWGEQIISFAILLILARLLGPEQFGIVALSGLVIYIAQDILRVTVNQTLVPMANADDTHFSSAFWVIACFGIIGTAGIALSGEFIANAFNEPMLAEIVPWLSLVLLFGSIEIVYEVCLVREMRFRPLAFKELIASPSAGTVAVVMAFSGYGVWSMVAQQVIAALVRLLVVVSQSHWRPRMVISLRHLADIVRLGRYIIVMSVVEFIYMRTDIAVIGSYLGSHSVGLYNTGFRILRLLLNAISGALSRALLPAFFQLQGEVDRGRRAFLRTIRLSAALTIPTFIGLACVSEEAVHVLLGPKWVEATPIVALLALAGAVQSIGLLCANTSLAFGKIRALYYRNFLFAVIFVGSVLMGAQWGVVGVAAGYLVAFIVIDGIQAHLVARVLDISLKEFISAIAPATAATAMMAVGILAVKEFVPLAGFLALPVLILTGMVVYGIGMVVIAPATKKEVFSVIREIVGKPKPNAA